MLNDLNESDIGAPKQLFQRKTVPQAFYL